MMNITQSLSSLSSWSSNASSTTNFATFLSNPASNNNNNFPLRSQQPQQFSLIQPSCLNTQMTQYFYPQQPPPTTSPPRTPLPFNNHNRRPITGIHNFPLKNKPVQNIAVNQSQSSLFFAPSILSNPLAKYSRKVFVGGLPPDIDEGLKNFNFIFFFFSVEKILKICEF